MATGDDHSFSFFKNVPFFVVGGEDGIETHEQVIPNGESWWIGEITIGNGNSSNARCVLFWDYGGAGQEILFSSSTSTRIFLDRTLVGDGTKKLVIFLENKCSIDHYMGIKYQAEEI